MTKKLIIFLVILIVILAATLILFKIVRIQDVVLRQIYPLQYETYVEKYSEENTLDKYLVYAVIKVESNFKPEATSSAGAIGLMQLMEETAVERLNVISSSENSSNENNLLNAASINEETDSSEPDNNDLYDPETNIKIGTSYLAYLIELYDGNIVLALTAYNAGLGNVEKWIKDGIIKADGSDIENIPYKETENYVRKILSSYQMYLKIY